MIARFFCFFDGHTYTPHPGPGPYATAELAQKECDRLNERLSSLCGDDEAMELELIGQALDQIISRESREQKIAAFRCFLRGTKGLKPLAEDAEILGAGL